jgi:hypothetical protein
MRNLALSYGAILGLILKFFVQVKILFFVFIPVFRESSSVFVDQLLLKMTVLHSNYSKINAL